jgi:hypothetical protein
MTVTLIAMALCFALAAAAGGTPPDRAAADVAREVASKALGIPAERFQVKSVEPKEWPDSSLGCGERKGYYLPVVTRGYRVVLEADGRTQTVHVAGRNAILCQTPPRVGGRLGGAPAQKVTDLARQDLAARLGIPPASITTRSVRPTVWPDASLGCPKLGMMYAQVETPGYEIELEANGKTYQYNADQQRVVHCGD